MTADDTSSLPAGQPLDGDRISVAAARGLVEAGRGLLVDTRDRRLYDNAHVAGAISLPLSTIEAANGKLPADAAPSDRRLILYCA